MPSPTQQFFDELTELSFADESYKQRFIEELHDHIEDAIHDADVRGVDDASAEKAAIQKLGSPKKLQKNFNRMMKPQRLQTALLCLLQFIGTVSIAYAALVPFGGIADSILNVARYLTGRPYVLDYPNLSSSITLFMVGIGVLGVLQIIIFQTALFSLLSQHMKRGVFWFMYIFMVGTPAVLVMLASLITPLLGSPREFWADQIHGLAPQYTITLTCTLMFLTICFTLAAIGVIARLNSSSFFLQFVGYLPDSISRPITQLFTRYRIFSHLNTINIFGVLSLVYLLFWFFASFVPSLRVALESGNQFAMNGTEPRIWWVIFIMPIMIISAIQTLTISSLFTTLSPINGIWAAGLIYSGVLLLCIALIILSLRKQKIKTMQSFWVASCLALTCIMILTNRFPNSWSDANNQIQWKLPAKNLSVQMDKKVFGPFYMLYNNSSLFTPITGNQILVDTTDDFFVIQTALGSTFMLESTNANNLKMLHRHTEDTINTIQENIAATIPENMRSRIYCGEKTLDKKGDVFSDGMAMYICPSIKIDNTLVASNASIALFDVAISPDNTTALVVVTENGKPRVYQVSLK